MNPGLGNSDSMETANKTVVRTSNVETDLPDIHVRKTKVATHPSVTTFALGLAPCLQDEEGNKRDNPSEEHGGRRGRGSKPMNGPDGKE